MKRTPGRGIRPWLILVKIFGVVLFLGALATLSVFMLGAEWPADRAGWELYRGVLRVIFWPCFFGGLIVTLLSGLALWLQHPKVFLRMRWFRAKVALLLVAIPTFHLWARGRMMAFDDALAAGEIGTLGGRWRAVGMAFATAFVVFLVAAAIGRFKPRLGERIGSRRPGS